MDMEIKSSVSREVFSEKIEQFMGEFNNNNFTCPLTQDKMREIISEVRVSTAKRCANEKLTTLDYRRLNRFEIINTEGSDKLIEKRRDDASPIKYYCCTTELYEILEKTHNETGHKRTLGMEKEIKEKYCNISRSIIEEYLKLCTPCQLKKNLKRGGLVAKPIISTGFNKRGQVDLTDMQTEEDGEFKFILNYQDHVTKFLFLRPLKSNRAEEVAYSLMDIFCIVGAPCVLHSDNGREFVNAAICSLSKVFDAKIVYGKARHSQSQDSVEKVNQDVRDLLDIWMKNNNTTKWSEGLRFVQMQKNRSFHKDIEVSPYEAIFGVPMLSGLQDSSLPLNLVETVQSEEDLDQLWDSEQKYAIKEEITDETEYLESERDMINRDEQTEENVGKIIEVKRESIDNNRSESLQGVKRQAENVLQRSAKKCPLMSVGQNVLVKIPDVGRGQPAPRNIMAVIVAEMDGLYKLSTSTGILDKLYTRNEFQESQSNLLSIRDVPTNSASLPTPAAEFKCNLGFVRCNCKTHCGHKKCKCVSNNIKCNSECHQSSSCRNK